MLAPQPRNSDILVNSGTVDISCRNVVSWGFVGVYRRVSNAVRFHYPLFVSIIKTSNGNACTLPV